MPKLLFKLSCGPQGFLPDKRACGPCCHIYASALSAKIKILETNQAKINIFCVKLQELSNTALACHLIVCATGVFPRQMSIFRVCLQKQHWKVTFKLIVILTCINRAKCYILVQEICGCDSNSAFTTLPSATGTPLFMFLEKKWKKRPMQNFVGDSFPHRGKCCGFVQEFRYWGQNPLCSGSFSVSRN